jgi:hypothetical protein
MQSSIANKKTGTKGMLSGNGRRTRSLSQPGLVRLPEARGGSGGYTFAVDRHTSDDAIAEQNRQRTIFSIYEQRGPNLE